MVFNTSRTLASYARIGDDFSAAVAFRAGLLDREKSLLHTHLALAITGGAGGGLGTGFGAATVAGFASIQGGDANFGFRTARGFFQRNFQVVAQIRAAIDVGALSLLPPPKNVAEDIAKRVGEMAEALSAALCT